MRSWVNTRSTQRGMTPRVLIVGVVGTRLSFSLLTLLLAGCSGASEPLAPPSDPDVDSTPAVESSDPTEQVLFSASAQVTTDEDYGLRIDLIGYLPQRASDTPDWEVGWKQACQSASGPGLVGPDDALMLIRLRVTDTTAGGFSWPSSRVLSFDSAYPDANSTRDWVRGGMAVRGSVSGGCNRPVPPIPIYGPGESSAYLKFSGEYSPRSPEGRSSWRHLSLAIYVPGSSSSAAVTSCELDTAVSSDAAGASASTSGDGWCIISMPDGDNPDFFGR